MLLRLLQTQSEIGMIWVRLPLAASMLLHGWGKVTNFEGFMRYCDNLGIPPAFAFLGACGEFLGGLGILLGCLSRIGAFGIACTMATAAYARHIAPGYGYLMNWHGALPFGSEGYEFHTLAIGMAVAIMALGPGRLSVDYYCAKYLSRAKQPVATRKEEPVAVLR